MLSYLISLMAHLSLETSLHTPDHVHGFSLKCINHGCVDFVLLKALHEAMLHAVCREAAWLMQQEWGIYLMPKGVAFSVLFFLMPRHM